VIKVLIAEDMHLIRGALVALLSLEPDMEVVAELERGDEIIPTAERVRPDVAVVDIDLPGLDGVSLLRRLVERGEAGAPRVIMLTVRSTEQEVLHSLELGAFDHLAKPVSVPVLMQKVRRALES
jgi:two-component system response regulator DesR